MSQPHGIGYAVRLPCIISVRCIWKEIWKVPALPPRSPRGVTF